MILPSIGRSFGSLATAILVIALIIGLALPTLASAMFNRELSLGMQGDDVKLLQAYLSADPRIYPSGLVTGYYGPLTYQAVIRWQQMHSLPAVGRVGPRTIAQLNGQMGGGFGIGGSADVTPPLITRENVVTTRNSATLTWNTSEEAKSRVLYSTREWPFSTSTSRTSTGGGGYETSHTVTLTGLTPNTLYYLVLESEDIAGNVVWVAGKKIMTQQ